MNVLTFRVIRNSDYSTLRFKAKKLVCAGFAGRDQASVRRHVEELAKIGVQPPDATPTVYFLDANLLTTSEEIVVPSSATSGEVEAVLLQHYSGWYIGVGSDHTEREVEKTDVIKAKNLCPKPVSRSLWRYEDVRDHSDQLMISSWCLGSKLKKLYQKGSLAELIPLEQLVHRFGIEGEGTVLFGGTIPLQTGLMYSRRLWLEILDPVLDRHLRHTYVVKVKDKEP